MNRSLPHLLLALALALLLLPVFPGARAQDTAKQESRRAALQKEIAQLEQQIKENAARSNSALGELTLVRSQIAAHRNLVEESEREIARIAKSALEVGDLDGLNRLSRALSVIEANGLADMRDLRRLAKLGCERKSWTDPGVEEREELVAYIEQSGILPERAAPPTATTPASRRGNGSRHGTRGLSDRQRKRNRQREGRIRGEQGRADQGRNEAR